MTAAVPNLPLSTCPQCRYSMNSATNVHGGHPEPDEGSFAVCLNCGQLLIYCADLTLRRCTPRELGEIMQDGAAWHTIEEAQKFIRERGPIHAGGAR